MNSSWPMFQNNVRHTGRSPYGKSGNWFKEKWKLEIDSLMYSSLAIDKNGTIYVGSIDWYFYAINSDGTLKWRYKTGGGIQSSPAIAEDGTIIIGSDDGKLYAFNSNGTLKWRIEIGGWSWPPVIDEDGIIYTSCTDGKIYAVYKNGTKKWNYQTDGMIYSSCVLDDMGNVYCGSNDGYMYAIYTSNGTLKWRYGTGSECGGAGATVGDDGTIYFGNLRGYLHAVNPNGTRKWRRDLLDNVYTSPSITDEGDIIVANYRGYVYSFNPDNGAENWKFEAEEYEYISSSPVIDNYGVIYFGAWNGWFYALNPNGTLKWKYKTLDAVFPSAAIDENGTIYIGSHCDSQPDFYSYIYALEPFDNNAPDKPVINGPNSGLINIDYNYTAVTSDIDNDNISYYFNWGDGTNSGWTDFVPSGTTVNLSHSWQKSDTYTIKVKAKDDYGMESEWGTFTVKMPRNKVTFNSLLSKYLELYPLLNRLVYLIKLNFSV
jgi:outer membrane protein assembly factor BamB